MVNVNYEVTDRLDQLRNSYRIDKHKHKINGLSTLRLLKFNELTGAFYVQLEYEQTS